MIDWGLIAAYTGPLVAAMGLVAGLFSYLQRKREKRIGEQIETATAALRESQRLTQERLGQIEKAQAEQARHFEAALALQGRHLDKQDDVLSAALQAIARIEGRLAGPVAVP